jgi:alpha-tubulin suppressor-like RCC1 family protein
MVPKRLSGVTPRPFLVLLALPLAACGSETTAPPRPVATVAVSPTTDTLAPGSTLQLAATVKDSFGNTLIDRPVVWSSSDTTLAGVSTAGLVSARSPGLVSIAAAAEGVTGATAITVLVPAASVTVTPESSSVAQGGGVQLAATVRDSTGAVLPGRAVTWTSGDPSHLQVSQQGFATGIGAADVVVTAQSGDASGTASVRIIGPVASVTVVPDLDTLVIGDSIQFTATPRDSAGHPRIDRPISWSTSGYQVIGTPDGVVQGVAAGAGTVTATSDGIAGTATIVVVMDSVPALLQSTRGRTCAVSARGTTYCWGGIAFPVPGITTGDDNALIPAAVRVPTTLTPTYLAVAPDHTCILTEAGSAYCWGTNASGQLGNDTVSHTCSAGNVCATLPVPVLGGLTFASLEGGFYDTCGLTPGGLGYCWGGNIRGEVGDSSTALRATPVPISGALHFRSISVGWLHTCGVTTDSLAYCWGDNSSGQLGIDTIDDVAHGTPQAVAGGLKFEVVTVGAFHSCAVTGNGVTYCWGRNDKGQLGAGMSPGGCSPGACSTPVEVGGSLSFSSVSAGEWHTCGITHLGDAYCWGWGTSYQLGNGSPGDIPTPVLVAGSLKWASISAGEVHTCGLTIERVAYCWGGNVHALGIGTASGADRPARVLGQR